MIQIADGSRFVYNTYLGGTDEDWGSGVVADSAGVATVAGTTYSSDVLTTTASIGGMGDTYNTFVMRLGHPGTSSAATNRVVTYGYDGLARLTQAAEQPGLSYTYVYDLAGNRTQVKNNDQITEVRAYNAANHVLGWQYDAVGNLLNDGETTTTYDSLNRTLTTAAAGQARTMRYNGDGALVGQISASMPTTYTQDLAAPLSQILQMAQGSTTTNYLYGRDRLAAVAGSTRTWYGADALGSVRQTLDDAGAPLGVVNYDAWGAPETGTVPTFGFTGELQDTTTGLVNLRARWYDPSHSTFTSRDSFAGFDDQPYSLHSYQYGYSNPQLNRDPSGRCIPKSFAKYQTTGTPADVLGIVLAQLAQDDCDWIWNLGQGLNTQDGATYAQSISQPWVQSGQAIYVLLTNREAQQAFADEYGGEYGKYKLGWEMLKGLGEDIYNSGTDLGNGAACHDANTFGRGLSRVALFLGNFVAGKLAAKGLGYLLKGGGFPADVPLGEPPTEAPPELPNSENVGLIRVNRVVQHFGSEVVETSRPVKVPGIGSTDIDVVLRDNRFIEVGGPSKGSSPKALSQFGSQMKVLSAYAATHEGGQAFFYYAEGTPQEVLNIASKWLGASNVIPIP